MKPLILIVEDETALVTMLRYNLERADFNVCYAHDGEEGLLQIVERKPDAVLLDWRLPLVSGIEVCRRVRCMPDLRRVPIIMLSARSEEADKVWALESGADDYVTKPFSLKELIARVRAVIRRSRNDAADNLLVFADLSMDLTAHRVTRGGRPIHLGPTEFRLLRFLLERPRRVFSREQLLDAVWGQDIYVESRTVDVHIRRLRKAVNGAGDCDVIRTVRSEGYALETTERRRASSSGTRVATGSTPELSPVLAECAAESGFTLIELLVVLAILAMLVAFVAPAAIHQLGSAKHKVAEQSVSRIAGILDIYHVDVGAYPTTEQGLQALVAAPPGVVGWNGPYLKDDTGLRDPWGRPFQYVSPSQRAGHEFDIMSLGADGKAGGDGEDADIVNR